MKKIIITLAFMSTLIVTLMVTINPTQIDNLFASNVDALAEWETPATGTCCKEEESYCCVGPHAIPDYYYKSEGPCKQYE